MDSLKEISDKIIGIIADLHDNLVNLTTLLGQNPGFSELWCAGDIGSPETYAEIAKVYSRPIRAVAGNLEQDIGLARYQSVVRAYPHLDFAPTEPTVFAFGPYRVELAHHPPPADHTTSQTPTSKMITISGHTHRPSITHVDHDWFLNPGTLSGWPNPATYVRLTLDGNKPHFSLHRLHEVIA